MRWLLILGGSLLLITLVTKRFLPRGIRNNNPGNIRRNNIEWEGMQAIQNDPEFVQFNDPEYGFRAMTRIIRSYTQRGLTTVRDIISTYAPATENHTANYIQFVANRLNFSPDSTLDINNQMFELLQAIAIFENGPLYANFYEPSTIKAGIALA